MQNRKRQQFLQWPLEAESKNETIPSWPHIEIPNCIAALNKFYYVCLISMYIGISFFNCSFVFPYSFFYLSLFMSFVITRVTDLSFEAVCKTRLKPTSVFVSRSAVRQMKMNFLVRPPSPPPSVLMGDATESTTTLDTVYTLTMSQAKFANQQTAGLTPLTNCRCLALFTLSWMRKRTKLAGMKDMANMTQMDTTTSVDVVALWVKREREGIS